MGNFSIDGLISGFDTESLINAMLDMQVRAPVKQLERRIETEAQKLAAVQDVNANLLSIDIAASTLGSPALFENKQALSSNSDIVSVSSSSSAPLGNFSIEVMNLAKSEQISSNNFTSANDSIGAAGEFIVNGRTVKMTGDDTLTSLANKITATNAGVKATVVQIAQNQNKLVLSSTSNGTDKIELREVGSTDILSNLGLISNETTYDYTINANQDGALSDAFAAGQTFTFTNDSFSITDAGGQQDVTVALDGVLTLQQVADEINAASSAQNGLISAEVIDDNGNERLVISSSTGIPTSMVDNDNALFQLGVVSGVQSSNFSSTSTDIKTLLNLGSTNAGDITLQAGGGSGQITVNVDFATDSLQDIVDKINTEAGAASSTLSAQIITANGLSRIELSSDSGQPIVVADNERMFETLGIVDRGFKTIDQRGENSQFKYNGVTVNRESNIINDLVEGVSLSLNSESSVVTNIAVNEDTSNIKSFVEDFVKSFNSFQDKISELTYIDLQSGEKGVLFGNSTVRQLQSMLSSALASTVPNMPNANLSELNDGNGVGLGAINITDRAGNSAQIDLTGAQSVQDVLDAINSNDSIQVRAQVSTRGTGLSLVDLSDGTGTFQVEDVGNGTAAYDLGIKQHIASDNINGRAVYQGGSTPLSEIGIQQSVTGSLTFDSSKLSKALQDDPTMVKNLLTADNVGFIKQFRKDLKFYTAFGTGALDATSKSIQNKIELFDEQIKRVEERAAMSERTLRKRFTALEVSMAQSQQIGQFLTQQLGAASNG